MKETTKQATSPHVFRLDLFSNTYAEVRGKYGKGRKKKRNKLKKIKI